jgi:hypothetical protein
MEMRREKCGVPMFLLAGIGLILCVGLTASATFALAPPSDEVIPIQDVKDVLAAPPDTGCAPAGSIVASDNGAVGVNILYEVVALSANDVWAVGSSSPYQSYSATRGYILHWNGMEWSIALSHDGALNGIYALSANDIWAVGGTAPPTFGETRTLTLHWNGATWEEVSTPDTGPYSELKGVSAVSTDDAWAVGSHVQGGFRQGFVMHWDGSTWVVVLTPPGAGIFGEIAAITTSDVWVVGSSSNAARAYHWDGSEWTSSPLPGSMPGSLNAISAIASNDIWAVGSNSHALHWDGTSWSDMSPSIQRPFSLTDVVAVAPNDVWAAGAQYTGVIGDPLVLHWDGITWTEIPAPRVGSGSNSLQGVAVVAATDVWAVGSYSVHSQAQTQTLIEHYEGSEWAVSASPNVPLGYNTLHGIDALSADDIWAVGSYGYQNTGSYPYFWPATLIVHWDGQAWSYIPSPNIFDGDYGGQNYLEAVAAVSADDVWAVGRYSANISGALLLRWNGQQWNVHGTTFGGHLRSITAISANDIWAVGSKSATGGDQTLIQHWDGTTWTQIPGPNPGSSNYLFSVDAISANDVWAVGRYRPAGGSVDQTLTLHWDGSTWSMVASPNVGVDHNDLRGVAAIATEDVWAIGYYGPVGSGQTLAMHWDGQAWSVVPSGNMGDSSFLTSVDAMSPTDIWAVGNYSTQGVSHTLVEHWNGNSWSVTPSQNASASDNYLFGVAAISPGEMWSVGEFATLDYSPPGTRRTLAEHFVSQAQIFSDVPPDNPFYSQVQCLVCKGIISGYDDGTFRPNNDVTRGQLSKIVSNSAGFSDDPGPQIFEDVPPGSTFYDWVNRLANRGHIGGYPCGGEGEPCGPNNLPYFRPNTTATRGQISKIVSNAAGYDDTPPNQTFEDVPPESTFYLWIERLASRSIMSGYPCGGEGEPCGQDNKPYFRWGNNATRGQTSKIVANTFFPDCQVR